MKRKYVIEVYIPINSSFSQQIFRHLQFLNRQELRTTLFVSYKSVEGFRPVYLLVFYACDIH